MMLTFDIFDSSRNRRSTLISPITLLSSGSSMIIETILLMLALLSSRTAKCSSRNPTPSLAPILVGNSKIPTYFVDGQIAMTTNKYWEKFARACDLGLATADCVMIMSR